MFNDKGLSDINDCTVLSRLRLWLFYYLQIRIIYFYMMNFEFLRRVELN